MTPSTRSASSRVLRGARRREPTEIDSRRGALGRLANPWFAYQKIKTLESDLAQVTKERDQALLERDEEKTHADTDALTGLPNRRAFDRDLAIAVRRFLHAPARDPLIVGFVDLDGLKAVNDQLGHGAGDAMIVDFGKKSRSFLRQADAIYRPGGDEFLIIAETRDPVIFQHKMKLFQNFCDLPATAGTKKTSFSIGHAVLDLAFLQTHYPGIKQKYLKADDIAAKLIDVADKNMYHNKHVERRAGRDQQAPAAAPHARPPTP